MCRRVRQTKRRPWRIAAIITKETKDSTPHLDKKTAAEADSLIYINFNIKNNFKPNSFSKFPCGVCAYMQNNVFGNKKLIQGGT